MTTKKQVDTIDEVDVPEAARAVLLLQVKEMQAAFRAYEAKMEALTQSTKMLAAMINLPDGFVLLDDCTKFIRPSAGEDQQNDQ